MMSDASDMLAAALEQMDGIIAGKVLLNLSTFYVFIWSNKTTKMNCVVMSPECVRQ